MPAIEPNRTSGCRARAAGLAWLALALSWAADGEEHAPELVVATAATGFAGIVAARRAELEQDLQKAHLLVDQYLLPHFDLAAAGRLILREHWDAATPGQQKRFVDAFYSYLMASYGQALLNFTQDTVRVLPPLYPADGVSARVRTEMTLTDGGVFQVDFYMRRDGDRWRIVDVIAEGISYVKTYRVEFGREVRAEGLERLITRLEREPLRTAVDAPSRR